MKEEARFFLRMGLVILPFAIAYWISSGEPAGTTLLALVIASSVVFTTVMVRSVRALRLRSGDRGHSAVARVAARAGDIVGFNEPDEGESLPLELEEEPLPQRSLAPVTTALAALFLTLGIIFGAWLWLPGVVIAATGALMWSTEVRP